jgi:hypothetical protein
MSFLAGLTKGAARANSFGDQMRLEEYRNQMAGIAQSEEDRKALEATADQRFQLGEANDWYTDDRKSLNDNFTNSLRADDGNAKTFALDVLNDAGIVAGGGKITNLVYDKDQDGFRASVVNPDGSKGAITDGGSNEAGAETTFIPADQVSKLATEFYRSDVVANTSLFDMNEYNAARDMVMNGQRVREIDLDAARIGNLQSVLTNFSDNPVAKREITGVIASAETDEEKDEVIEEIAKDNNIPIVPTQGLTSTSNTDGESNDKADRIAELEAKLKADKYMKSRAGIKRRGQDEAELDQLKADPVGDKETELQALRDKKVPNRRMEAQRQRDIQRTQGELREMKGEGLEKNEVAKPVVEASNEAVAAEFDNVTELLKDKSPQEVAQMFKNGEVFLSEQARRDLAKDLQGSIKDLTDLRGQTLEKRNLAMVALMATTDNATVEANLVKNFTNMNETGVATMTADQLADNMRLQSQHLDRLKQQAEKTDDAQFQKAVGVATNVYESTFKIIEGNDNDIDGDTAQQILASPAVNKGIANLDGYKPGSNSYTAIMKQLNASLSQAIAGFAAEEEGGFKETLESFFRGDVDYLNTDSQDFFLARVVFDKATGGVQYIKPPTQDGEGNMQVSVLDEAVDLDLIKNKNSAAYRMIVKAAKANSKLYGYGG